MKKIKKLLKNIEFSLDYYFGYFFYNGNKYEDYVQFMKNKWYATHPEYFD